jgi:2'-5' RNA ligase
MTSKSEVYTLVLCPPKHLADLITQLSADLADKFPSQVAISSTALPHLTVVQWAGASQQSLRDKLLTLSDGSIGEVTLAGLTVVPGPENDNWIEIPVLSSRWLRDLQASALELTRDLGTVVNGVGDRYRPHVTVGLTFAEQVSFPKLSADFLRNSSREWSLRIGISGENYSLVEVLPWREA